MRAKLTKRSVDALKRPEPGRRLYVWDSDLPGFGLVYHGTSGRRVFVIRYGDRAKREGLTIGLYGVLSVDKAREKAGEELRRVGDGENPKHERQRRRAMPTFAGWVDEYLAGVKLRKKRPEYDVYFLRGTAARGDKPGAQAEAMKRWETRRLDAITTHDVQAFIDHQGENRGKITANRAFAAVRACLEAAVRAGIIADNPAARVRKFPENPPRQRVLTDSELTALLAAVDALPPHERVFFKLLVETGCRKSEALGARWEDVDIADVNRAVWTLKSPKAGKPQALPLARSTAVMLRDLRSHAETLAASAAEAAAKAKTIRQRQSAALAQRRAAAGLDWVFPARAYHERKTAAPHLVEVKFLWTDVCKTAKLSTKDVHLHDLRRTYGLAVAKRAGILAASRLLRHADTRITSKVYAPLGVEDLRIVAEDLAEERGRVLPFAGQKAAGDDVQPE